VEEEEEEEDASASQQIVSLARAATLTLSERKMKGEKMYRLEREKASRGAITAR